MDNELSKVLEEIDVVYFGKKRNIEKLTKESNDIKNQFKNAKTNNLLYTDSLKLKERQSYLDKRLQIENNEFRGIEIARKILLKNTNIKTIKKANDYTENTIVLTNEQMNLVENEFKTTEWGWHCDGCDCGEFQVEIEGVGFLVVSRSCRKSSCTPEGMRFSFGSIISVYNKSTIDGEDNTSYTIDDFEEQGIECIGYINREQCLTILEYAKDNTIKDLGYDEYGNEVK